MLSNAACIFRKSDPLDLFIPVQRELLKIIRIRNAWSMINFINSNMINYSPCPNLYNNLKLYFMQENLSLKSPR